MWGLSSTSRGILGIVKSIDRILHWRRHTFRQEAAEFASNLMLHTSMCRWDTVVRNSARYRTLKGCRGKTFIKGVPVFGRSRKKSKFPVLISQILLYIPGFHDKGSGAVCQYFCFHQICHDFPLRVRNPCPSSQSPALHGAYFVNEPRNCQPFSLSPDP